MEPVTLTTRHLVKPEELNHHGSLYAGRTTEWFVEAGFIASASIPNHHNSVLVRIHDMNFTAPVAVGSVVNIDSKVIATGRTRIVTYIRMHVNGVTAVEGFITFIHVDGNDRPLPHGVEITPVTAEDIALQERARAFMG